LPCRAWLTIWRVAAWAACAGGAGVLEQVHPLVPAVPALGQVYGDLAAAVAGGAGGDVDEVAAQRGAAGCGAGEAGPIRKGNGARRQDVRPR